MMVGPPPPIEIFGQERPPPSVLPPRNPILKPVRVIPHCALPIVLCQIEVELVADLALDGVQEVCWVEEVDDDIEARAIEELVEAGEVLDALRFRDVRVVGRDAGRRRVGGALDQGRAGFAAGGLGERRRRGRERGGDKEGAEGLHWRPPARSSAAASQARCSA